MTDPRPRRQELPAEEASKMREIYILVFSVFEDDLTISESIRKFHKISDACVFFQF